MSFAPGDIIEGTVETIAFGGEGIIRAHGLVIFVPFTAPGDVIRCKLTTLKKSFAKGEIVSIIAPSKARVAAPCPYYGTCGGCQLQHLDEAAQLKYKLDAVTDALKRIGHLSFPPPAISPATVNWAYRRHITLHLKSGHAGYYSYDNQSIIPIQTCPIFNEPGDPIIEQVQEFVKTIPVDGRLILLKNHRQQYILSFQLAEKIDLPLFEKALQTYPLFAGIVVDAPPKPVLLGDCYAELDIGSLKFRYTPQTFVQNHPEQSLKIYEQICAIASQKAHRKILDLYCGFGIASLLLAQQGHHVTGIEYNPTSIKFAQENALRNGLEKTRFIQGAVEKMFPHQDDFDLIIINPPRQGLSPKVRKQIMKARPNDLIYVSCMPPTLARDLAEFSGYQIKSVTAYDMFPQTSHVETVVWARKES